MSALHLHNFLKRFEKETGISLNPEKLTAFDRWLVDEVSGSWIEVTKEITYSNQSLNVIICSCEYGLPRHKCIYDVGVLYKGSIYTDHLHSKYFRPKENYEICFLKIFEGL